MVHDIERGSEGHSADIQHYDFVVRVDGTPVQNLEHLRQLLMSGSQSSGDVQMDFLRLSDDWQSGRLFKSVRRNLEWTPPVDIGVWPSETIAAKQNDRY